MERETSAQECYDSSVDPLPLYPTMCVNSRSLYLELLDTVLDTLIRVEETWPAVSKKDFAAKIKGSMP